MKKVFLILVLILSVQIYGQKEGLSEDFVKGILTNQEKGLKKAEKLLKKSNEIGAIYEFHLIYVFRFDNEYERIAKKRIDSLFPILQKKLIKKAKGKWKLKFLTNELLGYKPTYEYIEITDDKIIFFETNPDIPSRIENINFSSYDYREFSIPSLDFENGEIWEFLTGEKKKEKRLYPSIKRFSDGTREKWIDEIGIIIDRKERKKAYAEERRTYYTLIE
ncbi:MAG: hypothetical protein RBR78_10750 [Flavobacteriaceae bacterium]|jgi:hypothetical protein|nr:hypothetical protein [Flavobacteriaceae bacterium]